MLCRFVRTLGRLGCVPNENLGPLCLVALGDFMGGGEVLSDAVVVAIGDSIVPMIQVRIVHASFLYCIGTSVDVYGSF